MKLVGIFENPKTGEVRVVFKLKLDLHVVVKLFRTDEEFFSVKFWSGDFSKTFSHWNTKDKIDNPRYVAEARNHVLHLISLLRSS